MAGARSAIFARQRQRYSALNLGYCDANPMRGAREGWIFPRVGHHGDSGVTDLRRFCRSVSHPALRAKGIVGEGLTLVAGTLIELTNGNFAAE
jgi:hypothetical protein